jgi:effector-binding domain-containing protein
VILTPRVVQTATKQTAVVHVVCRRSEMKKAIDAAQAELWKQLEAQGIRVNVPWFTRHLRRPGDSFDFELGIPVDRPVAPAGRLKPSELPAARAVRAVYRGGYEGLGAAWADLHRWVTSQGLTGLDSLWETYLVGPESTDDPEEWQTELTKPVED